MSEPTPATAAARPLACATGNAEIARAQPATYAAIQPFVDASTPATAGEKMSTTAVTRPSPSSNATTGSTRAFATTPSSGTWPNRSHRMGAVDRLHVAETATAAASLRGTG